MIKEPQSAGGIRLRSGTKRDREDTLARTQIERGDTFDDVARACDRYLRENSRRYRDLIDGKIPGFLYGRGRALAPR